MIFIPLLALADVWVDDDFDASTPGWGVTHFALIQDGIDAESEGGLVNVAAGIYYQTIVVNKGVDIYGAGTATYDGSGDWTGGTLVTRDPNVGGQATNQVVHVTAGNVGLYDLTVDGRYGFDEGTGQTTNYGIMVEAASGVTLSNIHVLDSTNHGIELNNADAGSLADVLCKRTAFAPSYYANFQYGLRCVDSENVAVSGFTAENVKRGIVVFQGYNSGTLEDLTVIGNGDADGYGVGFYTETEPGWWNPAWGDYEGDLTFSFDGSNLFTGVDYGVYISDALPSKDIALSVVPAADFDFFGATSHGGWRLGDGSVPGLDTVMSDMSLTEKTVGPPDFYDYPAPTDVWVDDDYCPGCGNDGHIWGYDAFADIQSGIDAVSGSTVHVANGLYTGPLSITSGVTITGESEAGVIVEAATAQTGAANTFTINASGQDITLEYLTVRHGDYGIRSSAGNVTVLHCTFYHNGWDGTPYSTPYTQASAGSDWAAYATNGGAMRIENSAGSEIAWCTVYENDRGIRYQDGANGDIHNNNIYTNIQAGIYLAASSYNGATGCTDTEVYDNVSSGNYEHGLLSIGGLGNSFTNNTSEDNWNTGIMLWHPGEIIVEGNTFDGNNTYDFNGVGNSADASGTVYADGDIGAGGATFAFKLLGNDILNGGSGDQPQADGLHMSSPLPVTGITVEGNYFAGMDIDAHVLAQAGTSVITDNSFNSAMGIDNGDASLLDASANYWSATDTVTVTGMISGSVDYSPWLGGGTNDMPGFTGDFSTLYVDDNSPEAGTGGQIQEGIDLVTASTVNILPGIYTDPVTIPAGLALTLSGAGMAQTFLTGGMILSDNVDGITLEQFALSGEAVGGRVIHGGQYNNNFAMDHVLIDGEGGTYPTRHAIAGGRTIGDVTITNCEFKNVGGWSVFDCATSGWETVMGTVTFAHNYIHECDGAVAFRGDNTDRIDLVLVHDNVWENINDNWNAPGTVENAWACFEAHGVEELQFYNNTMTNVNESRWSEGQGLQTWRVDDIDIYDNDFVDSWQGIWLPGLGVEPAPTGSIHDNDFLNIENFAVFATHGGGGFSSGILDARGNWWDHVSGPYHPTLNPGGLGGNVSDHVLFEPWTGMADLAILPASSGPINCSQSSTLTFHYTPDSMTPDLRGYSITFEADTLIVEFAEGDVTELENFDLFDVVDNGDGTITVDGAMFTGNLIDFETDLFSVVFDGFATGTTLVEITDYNFRDENNADFYGVMNDAVVEVDCIAPGAASDLAAEPGHNKVFVTWTDPIDADLASVEVWRGMWHDGSNVSVYPEYDDDPGSTIPTRPADRATALASSEWVLAGTVPAGDEAYVDNIVDRGIYYYELFAIDTASNYGPPTATTDRATSYWLADVAPGSYDGYVDVGDITKLGAAYGTEPLDGTPPYNNEVDVGPTDDGSGTGIPETDDYIGFEDMMIFALNYSVVGPLPIYQDGSEIAHLAWIPQGSRSWALLLEEPCADLKAVHFTASVDEDIDVDLTSGALLEDQTAMVFLENIDANGVDVSLGLMGSGAVLTGEGELFRIQLSENVTPGGIELDLRNSSNEPLDFEFVVTDAPDTPVNYRLAQNFPNPFNPKTSIRFDLPEAQAVRLAVYDTSGRQVALLVDEIKQAGYHTVEWNGTDDRGSSMASGIYFYRIEAGPLKQTTRMMLLK